MQGDSTGFAGLTLMGRMKKIIDLISDKVIVIKLSG